MLYIFFTTVTFFTAEYRTGNFITTIKFSRDYCHVKEYDSNSASFSKIKMPTNSLDLHFEDARDLKKFCISPDRIFGLAFDKTTCNSKNLTNIKNLEIKQAGQIAISICTSENPVGTCPQNNWVFQTNIHTNENSWSDGNLQIYFLAEISCEAELVLKLAKKSQISFAGFQGEFEGEIRLKSYLDRGYHRLDCKAEKEDVQLCIQTNEDSIPCITEQNSHF